MKVTAYSPYNSSRFLLKDGDETILGTKTFGEVKRTTTVNKYRSSDGTEVKTPGNTEISSIVLERGITDSDQLLKYADSVFSSADPNEKPGYKKELTLELLNNRGEPVRRLFLHGCFVSSITINPKLDSESNTIAIESVTIDLEGFDVEIIKRQEKD